MPVVASSAYGTAAGVTLAARAILNDAQIAAGDLLTDTYAGTFPLLNTVYHDLQFELATSGIETFIKEAILANLPAVAAVDASVQVFIADTGSFNGTSNFQFPQLPTDLLVPLRIWERQNGATEDFLPMDQAKDGLASRSQRARLNDWEWRQDGLYMIGSTQANDLRLRYESILADLVVPTDPVLMRGAQNALAFGLAYLFAQGRGAVGAAGLAQGAQGALDQFKRRSSRRKQHTMRRRRPFGWRNSVYGNIIK